MSASGSVLGTIAKPYANALFDVAQDSKSVVQVEENLTALEKIIGENKDFSGFLKSPIIRSDIKISAIDTIVEKAGLDQTVSNFVRMVARNSRLFVLPAMIAAFRDLAAKSRDELRAEVVSATPLSKSQLDNLSKVLKAKLGKSVILDVKVDQSLIGGLIVKVGSQMIDSSLKTKLSAMKIAMKEVR